MVFSACGSHRGWTRQSRSPAIDLDHHGSIAVNNDTPPPAQDVPLKRGAVPMR